jgi:hypothetical protein
VRLCGRTALKVKPFPERIEDGSGPGDHHRHSRRLDYRRLPMCKIAQAELDEWIDIGVRPHPFSEQIIHLEAIGEAFQLKSLTIDSTTRNKPMISCIQLIQSSRVDIASRKPRATITMDGMYAVHFAPRPLCHTFSLSADRRL